MARLLPRGEVNFTCSAEICLTVTTGKVSGIVFLVDAKGWWLSTALADILADFYRP